MIIAIVFCLILSIKWCQGIDYMMKNHPDYKGEDFLEIPGEETWKI